MLLFSGEFYAFLFIIVICGPFQKYIFNKAIALPKVTYIVFFLYLI